MKTGGTFNIQHSTLNVQGKAGGGGSAIQRWKLNVQCSVFRSRHRDRGSAVLIVLAVLAIMVVFVLANTRIIYALRDELRLVEQRQVKHWSLAATNSTTTVTTNATPTTIQP